MRSRTKNWFDPGWLALRVVFFRRHPRLAERAIIVAERRLKAKQYPAFVKPEDFYILAAEKALGRS